MNGAVKGLGCKKPCVECALLHMRANGSSVCNEKMKNLQLINFVCDTHCET